MQADYIIQGIHVELKWQTITYMYQIILLTRFNNLRQNLAQNPPSIDPAVSEL